ncbi:hypothetical protein SLA2020_117240 [Shorea laevis]
MHTSPAPCCYYSVPNSFLHRPPLNTKLSFPTNLIYTKNFSSLTLLTTNYCSKTPERRSPNSQSTSYPGRRRATLFHQFHSFTGKNANNQHPEPQNEDKSGPRQREFFKFVLVIFTNMWWLDLRAALGQRINVQGVVSSASVMVRDQHLALPHVKVPDVRYIDWNELRRRGFKGVVFDKDNTITAPYSLTLYPHLASSLEQCKAVFGHDVAVFSNSAGLLEYDRDGSKAKALERTIGIKVVRHGVKKPAGTAEEIEEHFGCKSSQLIMVGDRPFTDIVYGNRNGFFTILTEPLCLAGEPFIVRQVRKLELILVNRWFRRGLKPIDHALLSDAPRCMKDLHHL